MHCSNSISQWDEATFQQNIQHKPKIPKRQIYLRYEGKFYNQTAKSYAKIESLRSHRLSEKPYWTNSSSSANVLSIVLGEFTEHHQSVSKFFSQLWLTSLLGNIRESVGSGKAITVDVRHPIMDEARWWRRCWSGEDNFCVVLEKVDLKDNERNKN